MVTKSGGEWAYFNTAIGSMPAFLFAYLAIFATKPASLAVISLSFATYAAKPFFDDCGPPDFVRKLIAITCIGELDKVIRTWGTI